MNKMYRILMIVLMLYAILQMTSASVTNEATVSNVIEICNGKLNYKQYNLWGPNTTCVNNNDTNIGWRWNNSGGLIYPEVMVGTGFCNNASTWSTFPIRWGDVRSWTVGLEWNYLVVPTGDFDLAFDIYFTDICSPPNGILDSNKKRNTMIWLQKGGVYNYNVSGSIVNDGYNDYVSTTPNQSGRTWLRGPIFMLKTPIGINTNGTIKIDIKRLFDTIPGLNSSWIIPSIHLGSENSGTSVGSIQITKYNMEINDAIISLGVPSYITVVAPNGGENWARGTTHDIRWAGSGIGPTVKIQLYKGGIPIDWDLVSSTPNDEVWSWPIWTDRPVGTDYKVKITACAGSSSGCNTPLTYVSKMSDSNFTVSAQIVPTITVTSPNGGENWIRGGNYTISWTSSGNPGVSVKIELLKGGVLNSTISPNTPNDGSQSWTIPATQILGNDYKIRITSTNNSAYTDKSDNNFSIISTPVNLLKNPGFEVSDGVEPTYWDKYQTGTRAIFTYPETGRLGGKSVAVKYAIKELGKTALWSQPWITVLPSKQYKLSGYMKLENITGGGIGRLDGADLRVNWYKSDGGLIKIDLITKSGTSAWIKYGNTFTSPSNAVRATVGGDLFNASGKVWFDDIEFVKIS